MYSGEWSVHLGALVSLKHVQCSWIRLNGGVSFITFRVQVYKILWTFHPYMVVTLQFQTQATAGKVFLETSSKSIYDWRRDKRALISLTSLSRKLTSKFVTFFPWSNQMHDGVNAISDAFAHCRNWHPRYKMTERISHYWTTRKFVIKTEYSLFIMKICY